MATPSSVPASNADASAQPIRDRVLTRIRSAQLAADERVRSRVASRSRRREEANGDGRSPEQQREARALRRVFLDLGDCYRDYRRRTGAPISPEVRDAAYRFQKELDLASLVSVAASLDRLETLSW